MVRSSNAQARALFERAIELDPTYAPAYIGLAKVNLLAVTQGWTPHPGEALKRREPCAPGGRVGRSEPRAHAILGDRRGLPGRLSARCRPNCSGRLRQPERCRGHRGPGGVLLWTGDLQGAITAGET